MDADIDVFNRIVESVKDCLWAARDISLQRQAIAQIEGEMARLRDLKEDAQNSKNDDRANMLLGCWCCAKSIYEELSMWIALKEGNPDRAWEHLVDAQNHATYAVKAHDSFSDTVQIVDRLEQLEKLLFPKPVFVSTGFIVGFQECSICGKEYGECDHVAGKPYSGQFCSIISRNLKADHVAMVKNPADKCCRIMQYHQDGGQRNFMSGIVTPDVDGKPSEPDSVTAVLVRS